MVQLYFAEKSKEQVEEGLEKLRRDLNSKKITRSDFESTYHEKQRAAKDAHRERQRIELRVQKEVIHLLKS